MSSQGPKVTGTPNYNGFQADPASGTPSLALGYAFTTASIRDGSDWIAYKKQRILKNEDQTKLKNAHPEISYGNEYRIQKLLGEYKCGPCDGNAFGKRVSPTGPPN